MAKPDKPNKVTEAAAPFVTEVVALSELKPHPRNYVGHPDDQLEHIVKSLKEHGLYRPVVTARDGTILAGHGVVAGARKLGWTEIAIKRLDIGPLDGRALRLLVADNHIRQLGEPDDRALSELLKEIKEVDIDGFLGTGFDEAMVAALVYTTRNAAEIGSAEAAAEWIGMPEYENPKELIQFKLFFRSLEDRDACLRRLKLKPLQGKLEKAQSYWWPDQGMRDLKAVRFEDEASLGHKRVGHGGAK